MPPTINLSEPALRHNVSVVRALAPESKILAVIKADAYGHGLLAVAKRLGGSVDAFGVARLSEALALRQAGIEQRIVLMEGFFLGDDLSLIAEQQLDCVVHDFYQLDKLEEFPKKSCFTVWLKIDTGMTRLGFLPSQAVAAYKRLQQCQSVRSDIVWMSHFANAEAADSAFTERQLQQYQSVTQTVEGEKSLANSAAVLTQPASHYHWVRPGLMLYGVSPFADKTGADLNLKPVMAFATELISKKRVAKGARVGYGSIFTCPKEMMIGVVAIGYGDGYPREISADACVLIDGHRCPIIGRVSMDMLTVDLSAIENVAVGTPVQLWGADLPIEEIALAASTIPYTLLCQVKQRVERSWC